MNSPRKLRLFLDSNVLLGGMVAQWGHDKAVLSLCAAGIAQLVLAAAVREEVEENLLGYAQRLPAARAKRLMDDYRQLIELTRPDCIPFPSADLLSVHRGLIRHTADVPVLVSAMQARPDWVLSNNSKHFTETVAERTGLRIATPHIFFKTLSSLIR